MCILHWPCGFSQLLELAELVEFLELLKHLEIVKLLELPLHFDHMWGSLQGFGVVVCPLSGWILQGSLGLAWTKGKCCRTWKRRLSLHVSAYLDYPGGSLWFSVFAPGGPTLVDGSTRRAKTEESENLEIRTFTRQRRGNLKI